MSQHGDKLAQDLLSLAVDAGMPDSFWQTDARVLYALKYLGWEDLTRDEVAQHLS